MIEIHHEFTDDNGRKRSARQALNRMVDRRTFTIEDDLELDLLSLYGGGEKLFFFEAADVGDTINLFRADLSVGQSPNVIFYVPQGGSVFVSMDPNHGTGVLLFNRTNVNEDWQIEMMVFE